jgi:cytochrome c oxidase subunit III
MAAAFFSARRFSLFPFRRFRHLHMKRVNGSPSLTMSTSRPTINRNHPRPSTGGGGRGPIDRQPRGGGGGGGRGDDGHLPDYLTSLKRSRIALLVVVASITVLFVASTVIFVARKWGGGYFDPAVGMVVPDWVPVQLPIRLFLINTVVLFLSSLAAEKARRAAALDAVIIPASRVPGVASIRETATPWVILMALLAVAFLSGQWLAWEDMHHRGIFLNTGPASSFIFILTGGHAVHLAGGILVLLWVSITHKLRKSLDSRRISLDISALYWHFMGLLWLYIMVTFLFIH